MKVNVGQLLKKNIIHARLNHFLGFLHIFLRVKAVFLASGNVFSIECYSLRRAETFFFWWSFIQSKLCAGGNHYSNWGEVVSYRVTSLPVFETIFYAFLPVKVVFRRSEKGFFLTNPSFRMTESEIFVFHKP